MISDVTVRSARIAVAAIWLLHGGYNKLLGGSPRHLAIVQSVPHFAGMAGIRVLTTVGVFEVLVAVWILIGRAPRACAATQTVALLAMNACELTFARPLLLWPAGLVPLNLLFLGAAWIAADRTLPARLRTRLRRHPIPIEAHLHECLTLTYALPPEFLQRLLPPGLEVETAGGHGFMAVALVQTRALRPAGWPARLGQDFFLAGYRVFTTLRGADGRRLRGLYILRSDANRRRMVAGGNLLTHYNYHRCDARIDSLGERLRVMVRTPDGAGDLEVVADTAAAALPQNSPFHSIREARRFAGPLPFTFDHERETDGIVAIKATRTHWNPVPIAVDVSRASFFDQPGFAGCRPVLAAAFRVTGIDYRWERGVLIRSERS